MRRLERVLEILFIAGFFLFLVAATFLTYQSRNETYSYFENRMLAAKPQYSREAVLDGSYFSALEKYLSDHAAGRIAMSRLKAILDQALGRPVVNDVVVQEDILLPWNDYESLWEEGIAASAEQMSENLASVRDLTESYGGKYYYVAVPCQYVYYEDRYPSYLNNREEFTRMSMAYLKPALEEKGISYLDMKEVFDQLGHRDEYYSHVDNHYSIFGAYETYRAIIERLRADGEDLPMLEATDFSYVELDPPYLGSRIRKMLDTWHTEERLSILQLNDPIPFTRTDNGVQTSSTVYALPGETDEWVTYNLYMGGDVGNTVIDTGREELPSILVYGDSFTNAAECILYWSFDEMHSIDLRNYSGERSLGEYIQQFQPDYVVCIRDYESLLSQDGNGVGVEIPVA